MNEICESRQNIPLTFPYLKYFKVTGLLIVAVRKSLSNKVGEVFLDGMK